MEAICKAQELDIRRYESLIREFGAKEGSDFITIERGNAMFGVVFETKDDRWRWAIMEQDYVAPEIEDDHSPIQVISPLGSQLCINNALNDCRRELSAQIQAREQWSEKVDRAFGGVLGAVDSLKEYNPFSEAK